MSSYYRFEEKRKVLHKINTAIRSITEAGELYIEEKPTEESGRFIAGLCESLKPLLKIQKELSTELFGEGS